MPSHLLLIDDDTRLTTLVGDYLRGHGFEVDSAGSLKAGRDLLRHGSYDALLLDLMLPDGDGLDLTRELRAESRTRRLPLLMLTARGEPMDRIVGLEIGADDYLPKPFDLPELEARVRALLRRREGLGTNQLILGNLVIDLGGHSAFHGAARIDLSSREFGVLETLARRAGRVVSKEQILEAMTGWGEDVGVNAVEVYVHRLRRKVEPAGVNIRTVRGLGYLLEKGAPP